MLKQYEEKFGSGLEMTDILDQYEHHLDPTMKDILVSGSRGILESPTVIDITAPGLFPRQKLEMETAAIYDAALRATGMRADARTQTLRRILMGIGEGMEL
jgi:hypothetical protein